MIQNLIVSGGSFTATTMDHGGNDTNWPKHVRDKIKVKNFVNAARGAAGNSYICNSIIDVLSTKKFNPTETLVLVMWSGTGCKDIRVSLDYLRTLSSYRYKTSDTNDLDKCYVFSGGLSNSWTQNSDTKKLFYHLYKSSDPFSLCKDSLLNFINLENYLKLYGFNYKFMSFINYWNPSVESVYTGDYSIGYFAKDIELYKSFNFDNWIFSDNDKNGIFELAQSRPDGLSNDGFHPSAVVQQIFADETILPQIKGYFQ